MYFFPHSVFDIIYIQLHSNDMTHELHRELETACKAVQLCSALTDRVQKQSLNANTTVEKWDRSPVTITDFAVQALLTSAIKGSFHDDGFLAEEGADELRENATLLGQVWNLVASVCSSFESAQLQAPRSKEELPDLIDLGGKNQRSDSGRTWVFDPIDGTVPFLKGQQYAINCAFLVNGKEQVAIIGCPNMGIGSSTSSDDATNLEGLGLMVFAVRGEGTWVRSMQAGDELLSRQRVKRDDRENLILADCSTYTSTILPLHRQIADELKTSWPGVDMYSSLMKYAALGLGKADVCFRIFKYRSWKSNM